MHRWAIWGVVVLVVLLESGVSFVEGVLIAVAAGIVLTVLSWFAGLPKRVWQWRGSRRQYVPASMTPRDICILRKGHTGVVADRIVQPYIGQWLRHAGHVSQVETSYPGHKVTVMTPRVNETEGFDAFASTTLFVHFQGRWKERVALLPPGTPIAFVAKIHFIGDGWMQLDHAELVEG